MKIINKIFFALAVNFIMIAGLFALNNNSINRINKDLNSIVKDYTPAVLKANELTKIVLMGVEEAYSYPVLGLIEEKEGYFKYAKKFEQTLKELKQITGYDTPAMAEIDAKFINGISEEWDNFSSEITVFFSEYEKTGTINKAGIEKIILTHVDTMIPLLDHFISIEKDRIERVHKDAIALTRAAVNIMFFSTGIILIVFLLISWFIVWGIIRPIGLLAKVASSVKEGDLEKRARIFSKDEFGKLSSVFNDMIDNIQKERAILDIKIKERTKELEEAKAGLEKTVAQRTAELKEKLEDLKNINNLMVGRELKMIELKNEIEELKNKLNKA
ncbi:MAG: HAMP domain-containing protein [Candidatus Omnitrophica bacterium]|nr:HAMP domain-containing protein [Candidatus Omnitrophota bacterium]